MFLEPRGNPWDKILIYSKPSASSVSFRSFDEKALVVNEKIQKNFKRPEIWAFLWMIYGIWRKVLGRARVGWREAKPRHERRLWINNMYEARVHACQAIFSLLCYLTEYNLAFVHTKSPWRRTSTNELHHDWTVFGNTNVE